MAFKWPAVAGDSGAQLNFEAIQDLLFSPGDLKLSAAATAPSGWLVCDGSAISRTGYPELFAAIGVTFGAGDGSTTFNLPDLRGRVPVGAGTGTGLTARALGATGGEENHLLTSGEMPAHVHGTSGITSGGSAGPAVLNKAGGVFFNNGTQVGLGFGGTNVDSTGGGGTHNNMQPFQVVNWLVKT